MTHTPTPLRLSETCDHRPAIADANGINIASWDPATIELFDDPRPWIVRACNAHEELVAALRTILDGNTMAGRSDWSHADVIQEHYKIARRALAHAEKGE